MSGLQAKHDGPSIINFIDKCTGEIGPSAAAHHANASIVKSQFSIRYGAKLDAKIIGQYVFSLFLGNISIY
jgi:hypothetical protein